MVIYTHQISFLKQILMIDFFLMNPLLQTFLVQVLNSKIQMKADCSGGFECSWQTDLTEKKLPLSQPFTLEALLTTDVETIQVHSFVRRKKNYLWKLFVSCAL
jgi:hypothetical protein